MKKIYNRFGVLSKLRFALLLGFIAIGMTAWSQGSSISKNKSTANNVKISHELNLGKATTGINTVKSISVDGIQTTSQPNASGMRKAPNRENPTPITVCDGNQTNNHVPVYGLYYDEYYQINQMIYPSSLLTDLEGKTINSLTFYASSSITLSNGAFNIKLGTTTTPQFDSNPTRITGLTTVVETNMSACASGYQLVINLDQPYAYNGGNLVVEFQSTPTNGSYQGLNFYGITQTAASYYSGASSSPTSGTTYNFLPKLTFGLQPTDPAIFASANNLTFDVQYGESQDQTLTVTGLNLTEGITATLNDANGVYSLNTTNLGTGGGDLEITYSPTAVGTHTATITLSSAGADDVTINLNGSCANRVIICNQTDGNAYLPVYGYMFDAAQHNQILYPASKIATDLSGKKISKITFYPANGINFYTNSSTDGIVTIKLANMPSGTTGYAASNNSPKEPEDGFVTVKTITMPSEKQPSLIEWVFEDLEDEFIYDGGDLLIDVTTTKSGYGSTTFYGESQSDYTGYYSYSTTNTGQKFLPKVRLDYEETAPVTNGTVSPTAVDFGAKNIGGSYTATVTVSNTGNQPFTPTIDASSLPQGITVSPTTSGELAGHGKLNLTVTFEPTEETSYSGTFTVTIPIPDGDDLVFTVTVTGSGYYASKLISNTTEEIPVYKSDVQADGTYIFSQNEVINDTDMGLSYEDCDIDVQVLVKSDEPITNYDLMHKEGEGSWEKLGTATHQGDSYVSGETTVTFDQGATEMWMPITDEGLDANEDIDYVPVTVANGKNSTGNTYGAPIHSLETDNIGMEVTVGGSKSDQRPYGHWNQDGVEYCVYTPVITINSEDLNGETHKPYMLRAWLLSDDDIYDFERNTTTGHIEGTTLLETPLCLGTLEVDPSAIGQTTFTIGRDWISPDQNPNNNDWGTKLENAFGAPCEDADVRIVVRAYYQKASPTNGMRDGGGYGFGEGSGDGSGISTWVMELNPDRQVVGVTYVNALGMQNNRPFEGVNIVVTRYSDGTTSTSKVVY